MVLVSSKNNAGLKEYWCLREAYIERVSGAFTGLSPFLQSSIYPIHSLSSKEMQD